MTPTAFQILLAAYHEGTIGEEDRTELADLLHNPSRRMELETLMETDLNDPAMEPVIAPEMLSLIYANLQLDNSTPVRKIYPYRKWAVAAASLIIVATGTYLWNAQQKEKPSVTQTNPVPVQNDVAPGGNRATLTLADGSKIVLDSAKSGELAREENATITKTAEGKIVYDPNEKLGDRILYNTMTTPRGGQYQLSLPDGSQVWLNAESSISYPTAFTGTERKVSITGEAYFEVTKNKKKPFRVDIGAATIEVLGTRFNVSTYKEEPSINTTLLEGSVKIVFKKSVHTSLTLKPGQQGQLSDTRLSLAANPDLEQVMAWKNGTFNFQSADLGTIMRQLARWYDLEVEYAGNIPPRTFTGEIDRSLTLTQVLNGLSQTRIQYRIQGNKLTILP